MQLPKRFNYCWFETTDRRDIKKFMELGYGVVSGFWDNWREPYDYFAILDGEIRGFHQNNPTKVLCEKIDPRNIEFEKKPIFLGFEVIHSRGPVLYPLTGHQIDSSEKFYEVKSNIQNALLLKRDQFLRTSHMPGFTLNNVYVNVINQDFEKFHCCFDKLNYPAIMCELNYYK